MRRPLPLLALTVISFPLLAARTDAQSAPAATDPLARAQAAVDAGDAETALELIEPILKRDKKYAPALLIRSTARCLEGDLPACEKDLDAALAADPNLRQGWLNRSALAIAGKRWDDALAALDRAEAIDPAAADNGLNHGAVFLMKGELEPAAAQFRRYLDRTGDDPNAWYLVATNYAFSGYAALAVEHLGRAIAIDERQRRRARVDPNFAELAGHRGFQQLLTTDGFRPASGSLTAEKLLRTRLAGPDSPVVTAALNAVQLSGLPLQGSVEVTDEWALLWTDFRIKLSKADGDMTLVTLTAAPGRYTSDQWSSRTEAFLATLERELLRQELAKGRERSDP
jgi:tetratricopeptide (TPR) repeat protein